MKEFPRPERAVGLALYAAELGETPPKVVEDHRGDTYRAVQTVRFATKICVPQVFQKKSKRDMATPQKVATGLICPESAGVEPAPR